MRRHKLLTAELRRKRPALYSQDGKPAAEVPVVVKFFTPDSNWTWYATEFDGEDTFFGFVSGHEGELGYFSLSELEGARGPLGLPVERDLYYTSETLADVKERHS